MSLTADDFERYSRDDDENRWATHWQLSRWTSMSTPSMRFVSYASVHEGGFSIRTFSLPPSALMNDDRRLPFGY